MPLSEWDEHKARYWIVGTLAKVLSFCVSLVVKDVMLESGGQSSDSFSACPISLLFCPKHRAAEHEIKLEHNHHPAQSKYSEEKNLGF